MLSSRILTTNEQVDVKEHVLYSHIYMQFIFEYIFDKKLKLVFQSLLKSDHFFLYMDVFGSTCIHIPRNLGKFLELYFMKDNFHPIISGNYVKLKIYNMVYALSTQRNANYSEQLYKMVCSALEHAANENVELMLKAMPTENQISYFIKTILSFKSHFSIKMQSFQYIERYHMQIGFEEYFFRVLLEKFILQKNKKTFGFPFFEETEEMNKFFLNHDFDTHILLTILQVFGVENSNQMFGPDFYKILKVKNTQEQINVLTTTEKNDELKKNRVFEIIFSSSCSDNKKSVLKLSIEAAIFEQSKYFEMAGILQEKTLRMKMEEIHISNLSLFQSIVDMCEFYVEQPMQPIDKPIRSSKMQENVYPVKYAEFIDNFSEDEIIDIILFANFHGMQWLIDLSLSKMACFIKGKSPQEIREIFNTINN